MPIALIVPEWSSMAMKLPSIGTTFLGGSLPIIELDRLRSLGARLMLAVDMKLLEMIAFVVVDANGSLLRRSCLFLG